MMLIGCYESQSAVLILLISLKTACRHNHEKTNASLETRYIHGNTVKVYSQSRPGRVAQSVTCLATDACLTADPGVASSIPGWFHTFVEIDHEIISTVILLPSAK